DGMAAFGTLEIPLHKADDNLIAPDPDSVVRRPAAESARLFINHHSLDNRGFVRPRNRYAEDHRSGDGELFHGSTSGRKIMIGCFAGRRRVAASQQKGILHEY